MAISGRDASRIAIAFSFDWAISGVLITREQDRTRFVGSICHEKTDFGINRSRFLNNHQVLSR
jgi:hypothetical protein